MTLRVSRLAASSVTLASVLATASCSLLVSYDDIVGSPAAISDAAPSEERREPDASIADQSAPDGGEQQDSGPHYCDEGAPLLAIFCDDFDHDDTLLVPGRWSEKTELGGALSIGPDGVARTSSLGLRVDGASANVARLARAITQTGELDLSFEMRVDTWSTTRTVIASIRLMVAPPSGYAEIGLALEGGVFLATKRIQESTGTQPPSETQIVPNHPFDIGRWHNVRLQTFLNKGLPRRATLAIDGATFLIALEPAFVVAPSQIRMGIHERSVGTGPLAMRLDNVLVYVR